MTAVQGAAETEAAVEPLEDAPPPALGRLRATLIARPELIREDAELLRALGLRPIAANVVDFGPAALGRLKAAHAAEQTARQEIEAVAKANFDAQAQTHALIVDLLEARNNADLAARVDAGARERFGLAAAGIAVERPEGGPAGWRSLTPGVVDGMLGPQGLARMGAFAEMHALFPAEAGVKSAAVVRMALWSDDVPAVLAFGSAEPDGFTPSMGAELVAFLSRVVERTAERWPPA